MSITYPDAETDQDGDGDPDEITEEVPTGTKIQVDPNGGTWNGSAEIRTVTVTEDFDGLKTEAVRDGYAFAGWNKTDGVDGILYVFTAQWKPCTPVSSKDALDVDGNPAKHDPPVRKVVKGDQPVSDDKFIFEFKAVGNTAGLAENPMPVGSDGQIKRVSLRPGEEYEFGEMIFTVAGTYEYVITEVNDHLEGYTYDETVYTVTYIVEQDGNDLKATRLFRKNGQDVSIATFEFNNTYTAPIPPDTGDSVNVAFWMSLMVSSLMAMIVVLFPKKRRNAR